MSSANSTTNSLIDRRMGGRKHALTDEDRARGGRARSERKTLMNALKNRRTCQSKCPLYGKCTVQHLTEIGGECLFQKLDPKVKASAINFYLGSRDALEDELTKTLVEIDRLSKIVTDGSKNPNAESLRLNRRKLYDTLNVLKARFGELRRTEIQADIEQKTTIETKEVMLIRLLPEVKKMLTEGDPKWMDRIRDKYRKETNKNQPQE